MSLNLDAEWLLNAGLALSVGMMALKGLDRLQDRDRAARAAAEPGVVRAAFLAGGCQRRHDRLDGRRGARAARRRRHHWRAYQRWLGILQRRYWRHLSRGWHPLEVTSGLLLLTGALGFWLLMAVLLTGAQ